MRVIITLVAVMLFCSKMQSQVKVSLTAGVSYAGTTLPNEKSSGVTPNVSLSTFTKEGRTRPRFSAYAGISVEYSLNQSLSVTSGLLLSSKGWLENVQFDRDSTAYGGPRSGQPVHAESTTYQETYTLNYAELPLGITFYAPLQKTKLFVTAGAYIGYAVSGVYKYTVITTDRTDRRDSTAAIALDNKAENKKLYHANDWDYGAYIAAGLVFRSGLYCKLNFTVGLKDVMTDRYLFAPNRNRVVGVGLGYNLGSFKPGSYEFSKLRLGLRGGTSFSGASLISAANYGSSATLQEFAERKSISLFYAGMVFDFKIGNTAILRPSINWASKGWQMNYYFSSYPAATRNSDADIITYKINYIEVPLNLIYIIPTGSGKAYIGAGPYFSYAINARTDYQKKLSYTAINTALPGVHALDLKALNRFDYGLGSILGYEFNNGLFIEAGFNLGLAEVFKIKGDLHGTTYNSRYRVLQLGAGYQLDRLWSK